MNHPISSVLDRQGQVLELFAKRQQVLAGNIANADTPGFKARDLDFSAALRAVQQGGLDTSTSGTMNPRHLALVRADATPPGAVWRAGEQPSIDGNTVDLDRERANFADNAMRYEATLRFINSHVKTMLSAITGQ